MRAGRASKTAEHNALFRALEARRPRPRRVVDDPLARVFLSPPLRTVDELARIGIVREAEERFIDRQWPGVRTAVVARTALIDEMVATLVGATSQAVILGAGFDTRAYRLPALRDVTVFEVDHPDTQRRKRTLLTRAGINAPNVRFAPTDFRAGDVDRTLAAVGYDPTLKTLILWEGVTNYLTEPAVDATLRWCARSPACSELIFTYIDRRVLDDPGQYEGAERVFATLHRANEEMTFGMAPAETPAYLAARGLTLDSDVGATEFRTSYYGAAAQDMRGHEFYRVAHAHVAST
jgi:methyltransferase (TIGR00027 family)